MPGLEMKNVVVALVALLISPAMLGEPANSQSINVERTLDGVIFDGFMSDQAASRLVSELKPGDKLFVDSPGGEWGASLRAAQEIQKKNVAVTVSGLCLNECADFLFLASKSRSAQLGSNVRFGAGPFLISGAIHAQGNKFSKAETDRFNQLFRQYQQVLRQAGIPESLPICIDALMAPDFKQVRRGGTKDDLFDQALGVKSKYAQVAVSPAVFSTFKVKVAGSYTWPRDATSKAQLAHDFSIPIGWLDDASQCGPGLH